MKIVVQKFGGTSVSTSEAREQVYKKILKAKEDGYGVVAVVSAMGRKGDPYATDTLLDLIRKDCPNAKLRELDQIFVCGEIIGGTVVTANLQQRGHLATYLTGQQAGIITTDKHSNARILKVDTSRILPLLEKGHIVIVSGGQGATADGNITTLGRDGSDTTASALGVALDAESIIIHTDVEGIMTADPRTVPNAKLLNEITYTHCCEMAYQGAKVMHPRAVEVASQSPWIKLYVRSTFSENLETLICSERHHLSAGADLPNISKPIGVAALEDQIVIKSVGIAVLSKADILESIQQNGFSTQDIHPESESILLISKGKNKEKLQRIFDEFEAKIKVFSNLSKVTMIGQNLIGEPKLIASFLRALEDKKIEIIATSTGSNTISAWVNEVVANDAISEIHKLLGLNNGSEIEKFQMV